MGKPQHDPAFGDRLDALLKARGLSWADLARLTGLSRAGLSRWKLGETAPTWESVQLVAKALGLPLDALASPTLALPAATPTPRKGRPPRKPT